MKRVVSLTATLLRDWWRNREAVFFAFLFPVILLVIFSLAFAGGPTEFTLVVQNNDVSESGNPTELSTEFVSALEDAQPLAVERLDTDVSLSTVDDVEAETGSRRVVVIPDGFDERVRGSSARVRMAVIRDTVARADLSDDQQATVTRLLTDYEEAAGGRESPSVILVTVPDDDGAGAVRSIVDSVVATFNDRSVGIETPTVELSTDQRGQPGLSATDYFLPAFIVAVILINGVMTVPSVVAEFRRDGTLKRLAATPLQKHEWILANVAQQSILAVVITAVMVLVARVAFGVTAVPGPLAMALVVTGATASTALGMVVSGAIRNPDSAISLGGAITLPSMFVSGIFWELDLMPPTLQTLAEFSPVTHFHRSLRGLMVLDSTAGVGKTFAMLTALSVVFLLGAVAATDWQEFE